MAVIIKTNNPDQLRDAFINRIKDFSITTWIVDADGDFTLRRELWRNHAWMRYKRIDDKSLVFGIVASRKYRMLKDLYGIMHGRLIATLLTHFDTMMLDIEVTSQLDEKYDIFNPNEL